MKNTEIERKWLLDAFPNLAPQASYWMEQGYLSFSPNAVRIRKVYKEGIYTYMLTIKGGGTLVRTEVETPLDEAQYNALRALVQGGMASKHFCTYRLPGGEILECSLVDKGEPTSFMYAEVEFASVEQANSFMPPAFLGREVTNEPSQTMADYCRRKAGL